MGFTPAGKTPTDIADTIAKIYTDRYNSGVNDVKANPGNYGISTGLNYGSPIYNPSYGAWNYILAGNNTSYNWNSNLISSKVINVPLVQNRQSLYGIGFRYNVQGQASYAHETTSTGSFICRTVEGITIQSGSWQSKSPTDSNNNTSNGPNLLSDVFVDLLQKVFSTGYSYLILELKGQHFFKGIGSKGSATGVVQFSNINARYK